ncbi:NAD(P)-binding domain-containing protein [Chryseobacterium sp.]|uniref:NADPH-dependent F420 reductase n=1 Tax=Chryseobacterium sp. TaxID=1871047 RepID=UPI0026173870|nr:NAD(P)-binding domain-containing protein [Chryseobacterium sp.]
MTNTSKLAIIGLGNIGQAIVKDLTKSNTDFVIGIRDKEKIKDISEQWNTEVTDIPTAIKSANIIILSIPFENIVGFIKEYSTDLEGKIIVDPSNAILPDGNGGFKKTIGENESAGEINSKFLPKNAKLVKALGTLSAGSLSEAAYKTPEKAVLFYASDQIDTDSEIENLIHNLGFNALKIGGINQSIRIEVFGDLHEFGGLGKTVTLKEAKQNI